MFVDWLTLELEFIVRQVTLRPLDDVASAAVHVEYLIFNRQSRLWVVPKVNAFDAGWMSLNNRNDCFFLRLLRSVPLQDDC